MLEKMKIGISDIKRYVVVFQIIHQWNGRNIIPVKNGTFR